MPAEEKVTMFKVAQMRNLIMDLGKCFLGLKHCSVKSVPATFCSLKLTYGGHPNILCMPASRSSGIDLKDKFLLFTRD